MLYFFRLMLTWSLICVSMVTFSQRDWTSRKNKNGVEVFTKHQSDSKLKTYKAVATTSASVKNCVAFLLDLENHVNWSYTVAKAELLSEDENKQLCYMVMDAPWPVDDRDIVIEVTTKELSDGAMQVSLIAVDGTKGEVEDLVRIINSTTTWVFRKEGDHTKITYEGVTDPAGKVPDWVINAGLVDGPYETLKNFIELVSK